MTETAIPVSTISLPTIPKRVAMSRLPNSPHLMAVTGDYFGISVNSVVVGAYGDDEGDSNFGAAYLFEKPATGWTDAHEDAKLTASDAAEYDQFGNSITISGDSIVVGVGGDDDSGTDSGSVYVYKEQSSTKILPVVIMYLLD